MGLRLARFFLSCSAMRQLLRCVRDDQGQDLIEYLLLGSFVSIGALAGASMLGTNLNQWYDTMGGWVTSASAAIPGGGGS